MFRKTIEEMDSTRAKAYISGLMETLRKDGVISFKKADEMLYDSVYGCHFSKWKLDEALNGLRNEDGTDGPHWTPEQASEVMKRHGLKTGTFNEHDFCYVLNVMYSDYCTVFGEDEQSYVRLARGFLNDRDAPEGKALKYYRAMA